MSEVASLFSGRQPSASFSACGRYRYTLAWPTGSTAYSAALFILANPSTATAEQTDPTVARCIEYARRWGHGWAYVANVRAWRGTDPKSLPPDPEAIGGENDAYLCELCAFRHVEIIICGWGKLGGKRGPVVLDLIRSIGRIPYALKLNRDGSPAHPLYLRADATPFPMPGVSP